MEKLVYQSVILFLVVLLYPGSSSLSIQNKCEYSTYENDEVEKEAKAKLAPLVGKTFKSHDSLDGADYDYTVGICTNPRSDKPDGAVTQSKIKNGKVDMDDQATRVIGSLKNVHIMSGTDWVYLEYRDGENYGSHCQKEPKRSIIILTCDPNVGDEDAKMVFIHEQTQKSEQCYYLFEMKHQAICPSGVSSGGLSVGSILVIVFFTVAGVYLLVGFLYSRFILGHKGMAQIPNYEFWQDFGNLTADGCDLVCRSGRRHSVGGLGGIGDDQLDSEEVIRDENLLPM